MFNLIQLFALLCILSSFASCEKIRFNRRYYELSPLLGSENKNVHESFSNQLVIVRKKCVTFKNSTNIASAKDYVFTRWNNLKNPENIEIFKFPKEMKTRIKFPSIDVTTVVISDNFEDPITTIEKGYGVEIFCLNGVEKELESFLQKLHKKYGYNVVTFMNSNSVVKLYMKKEIRAAIMKILVDLDFVYYIEYSPRMDFKNKFTRASVQGGNGVPSTYTPYYNFDMHGEDQIVSIYDTGINYFHYFFWDGNKTFEKETIDLNRRKLVGFRVPDIGSEYTPTYYDFNGHGTHCCGTIAGDTDQADYIDYGGVANKAKLHVTGSAYQDANKKQYSLLEASDEDIFYKPYSFGIKIFSESWGSAVGSEILVYPNKLYSVSLDGTKVIYTPVDCESTRGTKCDDILAHYSARSQNVDSFLYSNQDAVVMFAAGNEGSWSDNFTVNSPATAKNVIAVGALSGSLEQMNHGLEVIQFNDSLAATLYSPEVLSFSYETNITTNRQYYSDELVPPEGIYDRHTLAFFSSHGPTRDLRIKPELVTTGYMYSSYRGTSQAQATTMMNFLWGTSMATPSVSGAAAIVRQYITEGRKKDMEDNLIENPPGHLIKAMLIHATIQPIDAFVKFGSLERKIIKKWPNIYFGFGILKLEEALQINTSIYELFYKSNTINNKIHRYLFTVPNVAGTFKVKATLVWYDKEGEIGSEGALINDLDLKIECGSVTAIGNVDYDYNNGTVDRINPVEQAKALCTGQDVDVVVIPYSIETSQNYSIVVTIENVYAEFDDVISESKSSESSSSDSYQRFISSLFVGLIIILFSIL